MSYISKCPRVTVVLSYWEASGEVSKLSYKSLLFDSSKRSYCRDSVDVKWSQRIWVWLLNSCVKIISVQVEHCWVHCGVEYCEELWFPQYLESILDKWGMQNTVLTARYLVQSGGLWSTVQSGAVWNIVVSTICGEHFGRMQGAAHCGSRQKGGQWRWGARDICINIPLYTHSLLCDACTCITTHICTTVHGPTQYLTHSTRYLY